MANHVSTSGQMPHEGSYTGDGGSAASGGVSSWAPDLLERYNRLSVVDDSKDALIRVSSTVKKALSNEFSR